MFQFYLSSIKRHLMTQNISENNCFNSTLVQLKELCANRANLNRKCFNSTLVQLKVGFSPYPYQFADKFQFYLSSIKSRIAYLFRGNLPFVSILP